MREREREREEEDQGCRNEWPVRLEHRYFKHWSHNKTPCPLMLAGTNHRSTDVTGVGSVLTFLEECKAAMECRKKGTTHGDVQLARTMKQAYEKTCEEVPGFSKVQVRIHPCWDCRYGQPCSHFLNAIFSITI